MPRPIERQANQASGKPAVKGNESSTREDGEWLATGCIWDGSAETAKFLHLLNTAHHLSGRCSEVSLIKPEDVRVVEANEGISQCNIVDKLSIPAAFSINLANSLSVVLK